ncbi:hypothetical protein [Reyranella sp.]|uniref:hypothetical protein n=1 Tax=Reyranella sp. TaxID=1929291 RepID=UPI003BA98F37
MSLSLRRVLLVGALVLLSGGVAFAVIHSFSASEPASPAQATASAPAAAGSGRGAKRAPATATAAAPAGEGEETMRSDADNEQILRLVGEARRLADTGEFEQARATLDRADKLLPGQPEIAAARREIDRQSTPQAQLALQLDRARLAIERDDMAGARKALAEAERLDPNAPQIAPLKKSLDAAASHDDRREQRIAELLAEMRSAIARKDLAAADRAFNEAARLDLLDPGLDKARVELSQAHRSEAD